MPNGVHHTVWCNVSYLRTLYFWQCRGVCLKFARAQCERPGTRPLAINTEQSDYANRSLSSLRQVGDVSQQARTGTCQSISACRAAVTNRALDFTTGLYVQFIRTVFMHGVSIDGGGDTVAWGSLWRTSDDQTGFGDSVIVREMVANARPNGTASQELKRIVELASESV